MKMTNSRQTQLVWHCHQTARFINFLNPELIKMYDVITVGSATVDVFVKTDNELIRIKTKTCQEDLIAYPCGKKVLIEQLDFMTGGGATNTGVCFSRLGLKTACLGMVGKDDNGKHIIEELKKENETLPN